MISVQSPDIVSCEIVQLCANRVFVSELGVLKLHWIDPDFATQIRLWNLPLDQGVTGPPPTRFGIRIARTGSDRYAIHLVWNRTGFAWTDLSRSEITCTDLGIVLDAIGTDLDELLTQPIEHDDSTAEPRGS